MNLTYDTKGLLFSANSLDEALQVDECLANTRSKKESFEIEVTERGQMKKKKREVDLLSWHHLVTRYHEPLQLLKAYDALHEFGLDVCQESTERVAPILKSKKQKYFYHNQTIDEVRQTDRYFQALKQVEDKYSGKLPDGTEMFRYQLEDAALMYANHRLLLGYDMGMGSAKRSAITD
ncbi:hypothetical protein BpOF4_20664 (plasmid) [Alkalihalophilus pseudofirmus OF4]|uniref:Uncharacterized protein n=1 Tax=Alkalihalophilus pseudofirmus (strain ATCC BAA-2126 / JCM 17055 / OF4) TaxID=398511 RepID=D3G1A2_ALKPO|nr:hypothetical protein [Alkalihalophilus pseudofirmus]ADC52128.1 hypothetical protein BpOF4_20664 [Alkalihalophilus pseudofirmus OF4]